MMISTMNDLPGYEIEDCLGFGGFGAVFAATGATTGEKVAVKVCHREPHEARVSLDHEIVVLMELGPPWAPAVHDVGEQAGLAFVLADSAAVLTGSTTRLNPVHSQEAAGGVDDDLVRVPGGSGHERLPGSGLPST